MPLLPNLLGFSAFGLAVRAFQLGIQRKPVASGMPLDPHTRTYI